MNWSAEDVSLASLFGCIHRLLTRPSTYSETIYDEDCSRSQNDRDKAAATYIVLL